jgi:hypothetical protein
MTKGARILGSHVRLFADGKTINSVSHSASRARASNIATIVTQAPHGLYTGASVALASFGGTGYTGTVTVTVVDATSFTCPSTGSDEAVTTDTAGTITQTGTASRTVRPTSIDANWYDLGIIADLAFDRKQSAVQIFAPNPGRVELYDVIETKLINGIKWTTLELSGKVIEIVMASDVITSDTGSYTPGAKLTKKAWVEVIQYDHGDVLVNTVYLYCYIVVTGDLKAGDKEVDASWEAQKLVSTLNSGLLAA